MIVRSLKRQWQERHRRRLHVELLETRQLLAGDMIVMYNDHFTGSGTHPNTTTYAPNAVASGPLKDIDTGEETHITLTVSTFGASYELLTLGPAEGTDAYNIFDGYVDFLVGGQAGIVLSGNDTFTHTFTGLNPATTYDFVGTAVRGGGYAERWTHVTLDGADSFTTAHSAGIGVVTQGLPDSEAALWTGDNRQPDQGFVLSWENIRPGSDGTFAIISRQYQGPTPGVGTGDSTGAARGYGLEAIRLIEFNPNLRVVDSTIVDGAVLTSAPTTVTLDFSADVETTTIDASDVTVDGVAATAVTVVDADTLTWTLPANLSPGDHTLALAAGAMTNTPAGLPLEPYSVTFSILGAPEVDNVTATSITPISAEIGATIVNDGGDDPALRMYWGDNDGGRNAAAWDNVIELGTHGSGTTRTTVIESLQELTTYFYRAFAENSAGNDWASQSDSFTTPEVELSEIVNLAATSVTSNSARINGAVASTGGEPPVVTILYGDENAGTADVTAWDQAFQLGRRDSSYSQFIAGLEAETTYYYTAIAENTAGVVWAQPALNFTTPEARPESIVINELHVDPNIKVEHVEYVELYNAGDLANDLSGWSLTDAVEYTFPDGTVVEPGAYLVVSQDPAAVQAKYGVSSLGPFAGRLRNEGDRVVLQDRLAQTQDEVTYQLGFPWPTVGDPPGFSMELIHPSLDNDLGGSWRSSSGALDSNQTFVSAAAQWRYFKGTQEPSATTGAWRQIGFNDSDWLLGTAAIGYGDGHVITNLSDMQGGYTSVYFRKEFTVDDVNAVNALLFEGQYDDGLNVWINGTNVVSQNVPGVELAFDAVANGSGENIEFREFQLANPQDYLVNGTNVIAVQLLNRSLSGSSDAWFDGRLTQSFGGESGATPGRVNSVFSTNAAPQTRQVKHSPRTPAAGEDVLITAKVTDPDGVGRVQLEYQVVEPGDYIELTDPRYQTEWTAIGMADDGLTGDEVAGDDIFSVMLPGSLQTHRRLLRYRITVSDTTGTDVMVPYADDPTPNFAYFVYDGVPDWTGSARPDVEPAVTYSSDLLTTLPTYQLLTTRKAHEDSQYIPDSTRGSGYGGSEYLWQGAFVYDGEVYDHIRYRARGGVWRYSMGKNMWKFDFNRGHGFQARDDYGRKYDTTWDKLNFSAIIQQGDFNHRGEQGMFEAVGFKLFNLVGVESPNTQYVHFRIVESAEETGATQFDGDFQGMYLAMEQPDGRLLDDHGLPDGNFYKMESGTGTLNNQGPTQPTDRSDLDAFLSAYTGGTQSEQWWRDNLDLERYYSYRAIVEGIHHYDIANGKNYFYYNNPETGKWQVHPWDLDLTWADNMFGSGNEPFKSRVADREEFRAEYRNRLREIRDLLFNTDQAYQLIDEIASHIYTPGEPSWVDADRAMWDYNPILASRYVNSSKARNGRFYQIAATDDFPGMLQIMRDYVVRRSNRIDNTIIDDDARVPDKPQLTYLGPGDFALNQLEFEASAISGGVGSFAAMKWRIAEVTDPDNPNYDPTEPVNYEINATWESDEITSFDSRTTIPATNLNAGDSYRVRVRLKNSEGYWSHWSDPVEFIAGAATGTDLSQYLRVSEIMYNPSDPTLNEISAGFTDNDDFEYVELVNASNHGTPVPLDLSGVSFTDGIDFTFSDNSSLAAGERVLVVRDVAAFTTRYGAGHNIAGEFLDSRLDNNGERLQLAGATAGEILDFSYSDDALWPQAADGVGASLELVTEDAAANTLGKHYQWRASSEFGGSPGDPGAGPIGVVISEVLSHTDPPLTLSDSIELHNTTGSDIDIGGWFLSDASGNLHKFEVPGGTIIPSGGYVVFDESDFNPTPVMPGENDFALNGASGDDVWLIISDNEGGITSFVDDVHFRAAANGETLGRLGNQSNQLMPLAYNGLGCGNDIPRVGPLIVSEIQYNPGEPTAVDLGIYADLTSNDLEFVELHNPTFMSVDLTEWRLRGGVDLDFAADTAIDSQETLLLISFNPDNPANADRLMAFRTHYNIGAGVRILGGFDGQLDNGGETVRLERPDEPPLDDPTFIPRLTEDQVVYDDLAPWPGSADGFGNSLQRHVATSLGNNGSAWRAEQPSPGTVPFALSPDFDGSGSVDATDIDWLTAAVANDSSVAWFDLSSDGVVDGLDVNELVRVWIGTEIGDVNLDGTVDAGDFNVWNANRFSGCGTWSTGDLNGDRSVDGADFNIWNDHRFTAAAASVGGGTNRIPQAPLAVATKAAAIELHERVYVSGWEAESGVKETPQASSDTRLNRLDSSQKRPQYVRFQLRRSAAALSEESLVDRAMEDFDGVFALKDVF